MAYSDARPLRSAIIGCGAIAHEHARFLGPSARAQFVGAVDKSAAIASYFVDHLGAAASFTSTSDLYSIAAPDIVHILTPPGTHDELVREALDAGCHVICEKPMANSLAQTESLLDHAAERGRVLIESANSLWNENVLAIRRVVEHGTLGDVREVEVAISLDLAAGPFGDLNLPDAGVRLPGGAVHDFLPHVCALFLALSGQEDVDEVTGTLENLSGNARVQYDFLDCRIRANGVRGRLGLSPDIQPAAFRVAVCGNQGGAETDLFNPYLRVTGGKYLGKLAPVELLVSGKRMFGSGLRNLYDKVAGHTPYHSVTAMLDTIYEAVQRGSPVPITPQSIRQRARLVDSIVALRTTRA